MRLLRLRILCALGLAAGVLLPVLAWCDDPPPQGVWTGKGQVGFVASQGNTEARSANAAIDMALLEDPWKHALHLGGLYGQSANVTSAERWDVLWQTNYDFTKTLYTFGALRYAHDLFSGFQYQESLSGGLGYKIIDTNDVKLAAQAGVGYRKERPEQLVKDASGAVVERILQDSTSDVILSAGLDYSQKLTSTTTLSNKFLLESGSSNTLISDALALAVKISTRLALSLGYTLQNNSSPPAGLKKLDSTETINLVFNF